MGRKLDLSNLSETEQANILQVIQRDFVVRKKESQRLEELQKLAPFKEREKEATKCIVCDSSFLWLFNQKTECNVCKCFFCSSRPSCGRQDLSDYKWICDLCYKEREIQLRSLEWFYCGLKRKFRRHGGAKVLREFYKKNKEDFSFGSELVSSESMITDDTSRNNESSSQTDNFPNIKAELEKAILSNLIPKINEIRMLQEESSEEDIDAEELEKVLENFLKEISEQQESVPKDDNELLWRYLKDQKHNLVMRILKEITQAQHSPGRLKTTNSSPVLCDAETMTEASDSEPDSLPSCSGSFRSRSSFNLSFVSDRLQRSRPSSLRSSTNTTGGTLQQVVHGVLSKKETVDGSHVNAAMSEVFGPSESLLPDQSHVITTELKFTAVDGLENNMTMTRKLSDSHENVEPDEGNENWFIAPPRIKTTKFIKKATYLPPENGPSAYDHIKTENSFPNKLSDEDEIEENYIESEIIPATVIKNFSEVSARSLSSNEVEYSHLNPVQQKDRQKQKDSIDQIAYEMSQEIKEKKVSEERFQNLLQQPVVEDKVKSTIIERNANTDNETSPTLNAFKTNSAPLSRSNFQKTSTPLISYQKFDKVKSNKVSESFSGSKKQKQMYKQFSDEFLEKAFIESYQKRWKEIQDNQFSETKHVDDTSTLLHENKIDSKLDKQVSVDTLKSDNESISSELISEFSDDDYDDDDDLLSLSSTTTKQNSTNVSDDENQNRFSSSNDELSGDNKDTETLHFDQAHESFPVSSSPPSKPNVLDHKLSGDSVDQSLKEINSNSINILDENKLLVEDNPDVKSRKSIKSLMQDLESAGLSAKQTKFNRTSLSAQSSKTSSSTKQNETQISKTSVTPTAMTARPDDIDWSRICFTVDPATYKKREKLSREVSLSSLIISDNDSIASESSFSSTGNASTLSDSLLSVSKRRSIFDDKNKDSNKSFKKQTEKPAQSIFAIPNMRIVENSQPKSVKNYQPSDTSSGKKILPQFQEKEFNSPGSNQANKNSFVNTANLSKKSTFSAKETLKTNFQKTSKNEEKPSKIIAENHKPDYFAFSSIKTPKEQLEKNSHPKVESRSVNKKDPAREQLKINKVISKQSMVEPFIRSSPVRGSLTMRGSSIKPGKNEKKVKFQSSPIQEKPNPMLPETLVFSI